MKKQNPSKEVLPRYKKTLLGETMKRLHNLRRDLRDKAKDALFTRQGITYASVEDNGYLLEETVRVASNGTETTKYRLFKLVDETTIVLSADTQVEIKEGIGEKNLHERLHDGATDQNNKSAI